MPFKIAIDNIEYFEWEAIITGHVIDGAYAGNEYPLIRLQNGAPLRTVEARRYFNNLSGWPIEAHHQTEILLHISWHPGTAMIDTGHPVVGIGPLDHFETRVDVSPAMQDARFWAKHLQDLLPRKVHPREGYFLDEEPPETKYFGLEPDAIAHYRRDGLDANANTKVTPFMRVAIDATRYIELEFNTGLEDREQFWLGDTSNHSKTMIGYKSRTPSLPALRVEELMQLVRLGLSDVGMSLLLLTTCYVEEITDDLKGFAQKLLSALPGVRQDRVATMTEELLQHLMILETEWYEASEHGWINKAPLSQRNPKNPLSQLTATDYQYIRDFFRG